MRVGVVKHGCFLLLGLCLASGCQSGGGFSLNPFKKKNSAAEAAAVPPGASGPGQSINNIPPSGVVPVGFEQSGAGAGMQGPAMPGVSLQEEPTFWEKTVKNAKPENVKKNFMKAIGKGPDEGVAKKAYEDGDEFFRQKQFAKAAAKYKEAGKRWPDSPLEEDSLFMQGESHFFDDRYSKSSDAYTELLKKYEGTRYLDKVTTRQFAIARYWDDVGREGHNYRMNFTDKTKPFWDPTGNAIALYEAIKVNNPYSPLADDALMAAGNSYFLKERFEDADYHYNLVRTDPHFSNSEHQAQAHILGLRAKLRSYQGPEYEEAPLKEAEELVKTTLLQFGNQLPGERERLIQAQKAIRAQKAEREWANGEYYYRRKYYRAAKMHYETLIKEFPDTRLAQLAEERIIEVKDKRPEPVNHFSWVGKIFGERKR
jgi:outer membrane protein assembly factor BamD (BamD/ComL family)